jgi:ribulose-phosphate 3-epimerase
VAKTTEIYLNPSVLNTNWDDLPNIISGIKADCDYIHLDVMDNKFVPNQTFSFDRAKEIIANSVMPIDAHLMISDPDLMAPKYAAAGAASVTVHIEAVNNLSKTINEIRINGAKVGVALKPKTQLADVLPYLPDLDLLLIMTVEPGFGGQKFMMDQVSKISQAKREIDQLNLKVLLQVDGGVSKETIQIARNAGANCFVAGNAVFKSENPNKMLQELRKLAIN